MLRSTMDRARLLTATLTILVGRSDTSLAFRRQR
jgi:hypothetical protein